MIIHPMFYLHNYIYVLTSSESMTPSFSQPGSFRMLPPALALSAVEL